MQLQPGTYLQGDKYRIIETLGNGGFGITYLAEQELAGRNVCIKEFFPKEYYNRDDNSCRISLASKSSAEIMDAFKAKFMKEAKTIARLDHPNIIHIHDVFEENNTAYYVMEYIEGESLSYLVKQRGALTENEAIKYIRAIAEALGYIHERKIMHLDIKPANVMLRKVDGRAVLIDFGLSKQYDADGNQTSSTPVGISAGYAPMEQYQQGGVKEFSPETDIYSLGATLYYLVTGSVPPQAISIADEGLPTLPSHLSSSVRNTIERSMTFQRKRRPHSIKEFLALLDNNSPKVAVSPTPASVSEETKIEVQAAIAEEQTVISTPQPKVEVPKIAPRSKIYNSQPKQEKESKKNWVLWILLAAIICIIGILIFINNDQPTQMSSEESTQATLEQVTFYDTIGVDKNIGVVQPNINEDKQQSIEDKPKPALFKPNIESHPTEETLNTQETVKTPKAEEKHINQGSVIPVRDIRLLAFNANGKEVKTIKIATQLRVDFELTANALAEPGEKNIYVRITNPDGYLLSSPEMILFNFEGSDMRASEMRKVTYENDTIPVSIFYNGENFTSGIYTVDIYVDGRLSGRADIYLN